MDLKSYLIDRGETRAAFAARVTTSAATITRIIKGEFRPGLDLAWRIERATGGKVPMRFWASEEA